MYKYLHKSIQLWLRHVNSSLWEVCDITRNCKKLTLFQKPFTTLKFDYCSR